MPSISGVTQRITQLLSNLSPLKSHAAVLQAVGGFLLLCIGLAIYWVSLYQNHQAQRQQVNDQSQLRAAQIARILALQTDTLLSSLDLQTHQLAKAYAPNELNLVRIYSQQILDTQPSGAVLHIAIADASGNVVYSSLSPDPSGRPTQVRNIKDREPFFTHLGQETTELFISAPTLGYISQKWSIQLSRAIRRHGKLQGVVILSLSPFYLADILRDALNDPNDVILLLNSKGDYLARSRSEVSILGKRVPDSRSFVHNTTLKEGRYDLENPFDGVPRYYAWRRLSHYPLLINVGLSQNEAQAISEASIEGNLRYTILNTVLILLSGYWIAWQFVSGQRNIQTLREHKESTSKFLAEVPGMVFQYRQFTNGKDYFPFVTPALETIFRIPLDGLRHSADALWQRIHPDDLPDVQDSLRQSGLTFSPWRSQHRLILPDGEIRWLRSYANPEKDSANSILWHGYVHDITEEHQTQRALERSEETLRRTIAAVQDGLWEWDIQQGILKWDARCYEMLSYNNHAFAIDYPHWISLIHPDDRDALTHILDSADSAQHYCREFRMQTANRDWLWVEARGRIIQWQGDQPTYMVGTFSDITARVEQTHLHRALLEQNAAAIFVATPERIILEANSRAREIFALPDPLDDYPFSKIHINDEYFANFTPHYKQLQHDKQIRFEYPLLDSIGQTRWFDIQGTLLEPERNNGNVIWTMFDITDRRKAQNQLLLTQRRLNAVLNQYPGGVLVEDEHHQEIIVINQTLCDMLRLKVGPEDLIGRPHSELIRALPPDSQISPLLDDALSPTEFFNNLDREITIPDGRVFEIEHATLQSAGSTLGTFWLIRDITLWKIKETRLQHLASTDALTSLPNRRTFMQALEEELNQQHRGDAPPSALLMLDLDHFKRINDTYGHAIGDEVLQHLSQLLQSQLREHDLAGRLGGEEFSILFKGLTGSEALERAEELCQHIATHPAQTDVGDIHFTASIGLVHLRHNAPDASHCLARADAALYQAKNQGRNRVVRWSNIRRVFEQTPTDVPNTSPSKSNLLPSP